MWYAEVYKIKDKNNNLYALKVKHIMQKKLLNLLNFTYIIFKLSAFQSIIHIRLEDF